MHLHPKSAQLILLRLHDLFHVVVTGQIGLGLLEGFVGAAPGSACNKRLPPLSIAARVITGPAVLLSITPPRVHTRLQVSVLGMAAVPWRY